MDEELQELRRLAAEGDHPAEAKLLQQRVASGPLTEARLRLAAHCGYEAAEWAADAEPPPWPTQSGDWEEDFASWEELVEGFL